VKHTGSRGNRSPSRPARGHKGSLVGKWKKTDEKMKIPGKRGVAKSRLSKFGPKEQSQRRPGWRKARIKGRGSRWGFVGKRAKDPRSAGEHQNYAWKKEIDRRKDNRDGQRGSRGGGRREWSAGGKNTGGDAVGYKWVGGGASSWGGSKTPVQRGGGGRVA